MSGPLSAAAPRRDIAPGSAQGDTREAPGFWEQGSAAARVQADQVEDLQMERRARAYADIEDALVERGYDREQFREQGVGFFGLPVMMPGPKSRPFNWPAVWAKVQAERAKDPEAFADLPQTQAEFDKSIYRRFGERGEDQETMARGGGVAGTIAQFGGGMVGAFRDPINVYTLPIGGGSGSVATRILREGLINATIEAVQTPDNIKGRSRMGEETSLGQAVSDIALAGAGGAGFTGLQIAGGKAIGAAWNKVPLDRRAGAALQISRLGKASDQDILRAFAEAVPAEYRTPGEDAAMSVLQRAVEIEQANPFPNTHAGQAVHGERLAAAAERLDGAPQGGSLSAPVVDYLLDAGIPNAVARGIAAGIHAESNSNFLAVNPTSGAFGIGQWLGSRQDELFKRYGRAPNLQQQLEFLVWELRGGDHGGKTVLAQASDAAALDSYIRDFMRPAEGAETDGDLARGMAALGREGEAPAARFDADGEGVDVEAVMAQREALDAERPIVSADGRPVPVSPIRAADIGVDAELMQFKSGGDQFGVTDRLQGVTQWDPIAAGVVTVWQGADGKMLIADGHQRLGLARRIMDQDPGQDIQLNAFVLREEDGFTAQDARILTALKNIGEGTGTAADAAKVFREAGEAAEDALANRLPPKSALVRDGKALSRLSDEAFGAIVNEVIPENFGAAIGRLVEDPAQHMAMVDLLIQLDPPNRAQAEGILRQALAAGFTRETQEELFGGRELVSAIFAQKARVTEKVLAEIRKMKSAFQVAARNADALEGAGNTIARDASQAAARANAEALALISKLAYRTDNEVSRTLTDAARRLAEGEPLARVVKDAIAQLGETDLNAALRSADAAGDGAGGSGRGGIADSEDPAAPGSASLDELAPATRDELEAAGQIGFLDETAHEAFDDPAGRGVEAASDNLWHDIKAGAVIGYDGQALTVFHGTDGDFKELAVDEFGTWFAERLGTAEIYENKAGGSDPRIIQARLNIQQPFEIDADRVDMSDDINAGELLDILNEKMDELGKERLTGDDIATPDLDYTGSAFEFLNLPEFIDALKARGFDGMRAMEQGDPTWNAFYPGQIEQLGELRRNAQGDLVEIPAYEAKAAAGRPAAPVDEAADLDTILQHANVNQAELADFGRQFESQGATWHDPGPKAAARITEKVENEGYAGPHKLKDIARGALTADRPELIDDIVAALVERFPNVHDKGWQLIPNSGYMDRKLIVTFEGGGRAELQLASNKLWDAKMDRGHKLYDQVRTSKDPAEIDRLNAEARELYSEALAGTPFEGMAARLAEGKSLESSASSSGTPSTRDLPTSPGASRQAPSSPSAQAMGAASSTATARPSISNNENFMGDPLERGASADPAGNRNLGDDADFVNVKGQNENPNVANRQRQEMELRAQAPLRGGNRTGQAQDGTMGLGLFDDANAPKFDLGDGQGARTAAEILRELDDEAADLETLKACGLPGMGAAA